jgi:hypothetical protein
MLRKKLAIVANIADFKDDILAKLMILEYAEQRLFETLYNWQLSNKGIATELGKLESICTNKENEKLSFPDELKAWNKAKIINWLCVEPYLSKIDLRDYYWISRDKLSSMQSNLLIPPIVKSLILKLEPDKMAVKLTKKILEEELNILSNNQKEAFFNLLKQRIIMEPNKNRYYDIFNYSLDIGIDCIAFYIDALISVGKKLPPSVIESLKQLNERYTELNQFIKITPKPKI